MENENTKADAILLTNRLVGWHSFLLRIYFFAIR